MVQLCVLVQCVWFSCGSASGQCWFSCVSLVLSWCWLSVGSSVRLASCQVFVTWRVHVQLPCWFSCGSGMVPMCVAQFEYYRAFGQLGFSWCWHDLIWFSCGSASIQVWVARFIWVTVLVDCIWFSWDADYVVQLRGDQLWFCGGSNRLVQIGVTRWDMGSALGQFWCSGVWHDFLLFTLFQLCVSC